ncbi:MAG: beta-ketoacyl-[Lentisphaeria bacterium]|nr:beta-ketoacyl-[acyl-carrier-protein] synthase family protein [Lentisphaeria bacterium]
MNEKRVVITGWGVSSALGNSPEELFRRLAANESAVRMMSEWGDPLPAAPVELTQEEIKSVPRGVRRSMGRLALMSALAAKRAAESAGLTEEELTGGDTGCVAGSTMGSSETMEESFRTMLIGNGISDISPMAFFKSASHSAAFNAANYLNITGVVYAPAAACASGLQSVGIGESLIRSGSQSVVLCGGADEVTRVVSGCFELMEAHAPSEGVAPENAPRPFEKNRSGLVCGEGAAFVVLEDYEHAKKRSAPILGEIYGYATCRCPNQVSQSDSRSILRCLNSVYKAAGISVEETDYISAHATSTRQGDQAEAEALREFFGDRVPLSSLKGHLGHTLGASGVLEMIVSLEMMNRGLLLPTRNLEEVSPECAGLYHLRSAEEKKVKTILKNCFAFGGINSTLLFGKLK